MHFAEPVSHEAFMARALYDPTAGYYSTKAAVGKLGDFSTSATLSKSFAQAISNWVFETASRLNIGAPYPLIELGPGNGDLALSLSKSIPEGSLHLVETSPQLREAQQAKLCGRQFRHYDNLDSALQATDGLGLVIANEFIDAFPAAKLRWHNDDWYEVGVSFEEGVAKEILAPLEREIDADAPVYPKDGETIYVHPAFHHWLQNNMKGLSRGALLFIDYGAERPARECRAYADQERFEGIKVYENAGKRDITCDINFTDLNRWCQSLGLSPKTSTSQAEFLESFLNDIEKRRQHDVAFAFLSNPFGAGGAFRVMVAERS